jgi:hypothetical protein
MSTDRTCEVRMYRVNERCRKNHGVNPGDCQTCRIGCFKPARWLNPYFGSDVPDERFWWRNPFNYAQYLCADCYDSMMEELKDYEEMFGEEANDDVA